MAFDTFDIWQRRGVKAIFRAVNVAVGCIDGEAVLRVFFIRTCACFSPGQNKVAIITRCSY